MIFDLGGVVFRYRPEVRLAAFAAVSGRSLADVRKALMDSGYSRSCDAGRLSGEAAYREGVRLLGRRIGFERFRSHWIDAFEPDEAVVALARQLKPKLPVAMLTNNSDMVRSGLEARFPDIMELFRPRLFSAEAGLLKPDPRLFRTLLELMGLAAEQVLYVDDDPAHADAAASLGLDACRYQSAAALERDLEARGLLP